MSKNYRCLVAATSKFSRKFLYLLLVLFPLAVSGQDSFSSMADEPFLYQQLPNDAFPEAGIIPEPESVILRGDGGGGSGAGQDDVPVSEAWLVMGGLILIYGLYQIRGEKKRS